MMLAVMPDSKRRDFLGTAAGVAAFTIVPRHVLGGQGGVAPSDKITLGYIGTGTQGLREILPLLAAPEIQVISVCDPCKEAVGYRDWSKDGLNNTIRRALGKPDWNPGGDIPGGRDAGKSVVEGWYAKNKPSGAYKGCTAYADFREMLAKEKDLNAVKIMTPDHLHGVAAIAAMKRGKHVIMHKPVANRLNEAMLAIDTARKTGVATHFMPWDANGSMEQVLAWIKDGSIGTLREVHNWTNRPVWPQYPTLPAENPPVPAGFDWDLWLGPEAERPYSPNYTHMVFRGWYDFGGGPMADMGHYSLWTVFNALELSGPTSIEPMRSHHCVFNKDQTSSRVKNDFSFPEAGAVRFKYPARGSRPAVDLIWYEGGMHPPTPDEMDEDKKEFAIEAMMFLRSASGARPASRGSSRRGFSNGSPPAAAANSRPAASRTRVPSRRPSTSTRWRCAPGSGCCTTPPRAKSPTPRTPTGIFRASIARAGSPSPSRRPPCAYREDIFWPAGRR